MVEGPNRLSRQETLNFVDPEDDLDAEEPRKCDEKCVFDMIFGLFTAHGGLRGRRGQAHFARTSTTLREAEGC